MAQLIFSSIEGGVGDSMTDEQIEALLEEIEHEFDCGYAKALRAVRDREFCVRFRGFQTIGYTHNYGRIEELVGYPAAATPDELTVEEIREIIKEAQDRAGADGISIEGGFDVLYDCDNEEEAEGVWDAMAYDIYEPSFFDVTLWERNPKPAKFPVS